MIEKAKIEAIKRDVDLVGLIEARGVALKKNGKGYKGHCPFHEDMETPSFSVTPAKNLWQCFGCGKGGDPIEFVRLFDKVEFKEAVEILSGSALLTPAKTVKKETDEPKPLTGAHVKLLVRVIDFYHTAFCEDVRAKEYLEKRGITDKSLCADHKIGFANGTLLNVLPEAEGEPGREGDIRQQLQELGILNGKGNEHFYGCVTFPLYDPAGNPSGIYGRRTPGMGEGVEHLYLPGPRHGIFNRQAAMAHKEIILTEAVIDAVTLIN
ncbi:MAG: CHC2 zinc finger domain-containing protein, partial [Desulfobacterales bacterium]|nr:CHC2 zinc finger domain-containing protein [Desulfobacterales bacterium]